MERIILCESSVSMRMILTNLFSLTVASSTFGRATSRLAPNSTLLYIFLGSMYKGHLQKCELTKQTSRRGEVVQTCAHPRWHHEGSPQQSPHPKRAVQCLQNSGSERSRGKLCRSWHQTASGALDCPNFNHER